MKGIQLREKCKELRLMIILEYFLNFAQFKFCILFICMCMSTDTHMEFNEQPVNRFSSHPDLRDWTRVLGPQDKHLDP